MRFSGYPSTSRTYADENAVKTKTKVGAKTCISRLRVSKQHCERKNRLSERPPWRGINISDPGRKGRNRAVSTPLIAHFLSRLLGLMHHLQDSHLTKPQQYVRAGNQDHSDFSIGSFLLFWYPGPNPSHFLTHLGEHQQQLLGLPEALHPHRGALVRRDPVPVRSAPLQRSETVVRVGLKETRV